MEPIRIFIADDDPDDREFLRLALESKNAATEVTEFPDGNFLSDYFESPSNDIPDLIVLDLNMPRQDGFKTLDMLKIQKRLNKIPVMILTSSRNPEDERRCRELGCDLFETKPMEMSSYGKLAHSILKFVHA